LKKFKILWGKIRKGGDARLENLKSKEKTQVFVFEMRMQVRRKLKEYL